MHHHDLTSVTPTFHKLLWCHKWPQMHRLYRYWSGTGTQKCRSDHWLDSKRQCIFLVKWSLIFFLIVKVSRLLSRRFPSAWSSHHWSTAQPSSFPEWFVPLCAIRADTQVLPGSTAEHTYGVLMKQLQALDLPTWTSVMSETRKLGTLFFADTGVLWCIGLVDVVQCADSDRDRQ